MPTIKVEPALSDVHAEPMAAEHLKSNRGAGECGSSVLPPQPARPKQRARHRMALKGRIPIAYCTLFAADVHTSVHDEVALQIIGYGTTVAGGVHIQFAVKALLGSA